MEMPYKFELAGYCEGCPYFWEELDSTDVTSLEDSERKVLHIVRCHNRDACARAVRIVNQVSG